MRPFILKVFYSIISSPRTRWMMFTLLFGASPIYMRMTCLSVDSHAPHFVLSDFVFFGLMLNASIVANLSQTKFRPDVYLIFVGLSAVTSSVLVGCFVKDINGQADSVAWFITVGIIVLSAGLSFITTNDKALERIQKEVDFANNLNKLPPELRDALIGNVCDEWKAGSKESHELTMQDAERLASERG